MNRGRNITIDLFDLMGNVLKKWRWILLAAILCGGAAFAGTYFLISPMYESSFTAYINNKSDTESTEQISSSDITASEYLAETYSIVIASKTNLESAIEEAELRYSYDDVSGWVSVDDVDGTQIISVKVKCENAEEAYLLCSALEEVSPDYVADIIEGSSMKIVTGAEYEPDKVSPSLAKNTAYGAAFGILVSAFLFAAFFVMDQRIKSRDDLEMYFDIPVIGIIHDMASLPEGKGYGYGYGYGYHAEEKDSTTRHLEPYGS